VAASSVNRDVFFFYFFVVVEQFSVILLHNGVVKDDQLELISCRFIGFLTLLTMFGFV